MAWALLALGLVLMAEGLIWALAPRLVEDILAAVRSLTLEERRLAGLAAVATGAALVWVWRLVAGPL